MNEDRNTLFVTLLAAHERRLQHYVRILLPNPHAADDVLQESKLAMWQHFDQFEEGTNFNAWAHRFVFNRVLAHRTKQKRENDRVIFSDAFYEMLSEQVERQPDIVEEKIGKLYHCIDQLPERQRGMLKMRYFQEQSIEDIALTVNKSMDATYRAISRIRMTLHDCMNRQLAES